MHRSLTDTTCGATETQGDTTYVVESSLTVIGVRLGVGGMVGGAGHGHTAKLGRGRGKAGRTKNGHSCAFKMHRRTYRSAPTTDAHTPKTECFRALTVVGVGLGVGGVVGGVGHGHVAELGLGRAEAGRHRRRVLRPHTAPQRDLPYHDHGKDP
jgi:hypothetical protein